MGMDRGLAWNDENFCERIAINLESIDVAQIMLLSSP